MATIMHLDMDSFFASVEQQANPKLVNRPVAVIKGPGRTCVIAASREAKRLGIKTGTSTYEARAVCPEISLVPADFEKYFSVTQGFIEICGRYSPCLEVFSIDELFLDVDQSQASFGGTREICRRIKQDIKKEIGAHITCSIGIAHNRLLAKLASGINKPNGIFEITPENKDQVLFNCKLTDVCGLGCRLEKKLFNLGITDFKNLRKIPSENLTASLGPYWSKELKKLADGEDDSLLTRISEIPQMRSVSRTFTLYKDTTEPEKIKATLRGLCEEVAFKTRQMKMKARLVGVAVRGGGRGDHHQQSRQSFFDSGREIFTVAWNLLQKMESIKPVRFLGVWLGDLKPQTNFNPSLFAAEEREKRLNQALDAVNKRFGESTIYPAVLLQGGLLKSEVNGFLGDKGYHFNLGI